MMINVSSSGDLRLTPAKKSYPYGKYRNDDQYHEQAHHDHIYDLKNCFPLIIFFF